MYEREAAAVRGRKDANPHNKQTMRDCVNMCGGKVGHKNTTGYCAACKYDMKVDGELRVYQKIELNMIVTAVKSL